jgi:hypothetical protein
MTGVVSLVASIVAILVFVGLYVWYAAMLARWFPRLGAPSWKGWVPFVNEAEILHLGGYPRWAIVFLLVPVVNLCGVVLRAIAAHRIGRDLGHGAGATVLAVLLPPAWATVLASGRPPAPEVTHRIATEPLLAGAPAAAPAPPLENGPVVRSAPPVLRADPPMMAAPAAAPAPAAAAPAPLPTPAPLTPPVAPPTTITAPAWNAPADLEPLPTPSVAALIAPPPTAAGSRPAAPEQPSVSRFAPPGAAPGPLLPATPPPPVDDAPDVEPAIASPDAGPAPAPLPDPWDEDDDGETIVVDRGPIARWELVLDDGPSYPLAAASVVLGRRPAGADAATQYLAVHDTTRTLSKIHARLDLQDDDWRIIDLRSTNGVLVLDPDGSEHALDAGSAVLLGGRPFLLGRVAMRVQRIGGPDGADGAGAGG